MDELEITQPEQSLDAGEAAEAVDVEEATEAQALDDATHEPGAVIEETQTFEQAEAVESALTEAVDSVEASAVGDLPIPMPNPADEQGEQHGTLPVPMPEPAYGPGPAPPPDDDVQISSEGTGEEQVGGLPLPVFNTALEDDGNNLAIEDDNEGGRQDVAVDPAPMWNTPDLSPGVDGNVAESPDEPTPPGPNLEDQEML